MKSVSLPSRAELVRAYERLQWAKEIPDADALVLWAHWARLDPRLAEILLRFFMRSFRQVHPTLLWEANRRSPCPQSLAVLVEFARAPDGEKPAFQGWANTVQAGVSKATPQMFFVREGTPAPARDQAARERNLRPFARWGFFGDQSLRSEKNSEHLTFLTGEARARILADLKRAHRSFTVKDYIAACQGRVHRRTAERDLQKTPGLESRGLTRAKIYRAKTPKRARAGRKTK